MGRNQMTRRIYQYFLMCCMIFYTSCSYDFDEKASKIYQDMYIDITQSAYNERIFKFMLESLAPNYCSIYKDSSDTSLLITDLCGVVQSRYGYFRVGSKKNSVISFIDSGPVQEYDIRQFKLVLNLKKTENANVAFMV